MFKKYVLTVLICFFLVSCQKKEGSINEEREPQSSILYAKGFDIITENSNVKLIIKNPYQNTKEHFTYTFLKKSDSENKDLEKNVIETPVKELIITSTTHIPMVEMLEQEKSIVGFPHTNYISSEKIRKLVDDEQIKEIGKEGALNTEIVLELNPELIVGYTVNNADRSLTTLQKSGVPVIYNGDWLEETPLGRAEWIKFFGVLFDKQKAADSIFKEIEKNYYEAKKIANKAKSQKTVLSGAIMSNDLWNLPAGESFVAQFLKDANLNYLWKDTEGKGSLSLSFESVYDKGLEADFWISPGYFSSKKQMLSYNELYKNFNAFKDDKIYTPTTKKGISEGVLYYELGPSRPDLVLKDIIKITQPDLLEDYELTFFERMK